MSADRGATVIVGTGPAGVSAAHALRRRGWPVHLLEAGKDLRLSPPSGSYLDLRFGDRSQWVWQLGRPGASVEAAAHTSPKLRVPTLRAVFDGYAQANRISGSDGFQVVGALAPGGLSNAWGCGVARFDAGELGPLGAEAAALDRAYAEVALRMGLSGAGDDALKDYLGVDDWSSPALPLDAIQRRIWARRQQLPSGFRLGRARVAVLAEAREGRAACDQSGTCLWGCARRATWSAAIDVEQLRRDPGVRIEFEARVEGIAADGEGGWWLSIAGPAGLRQLRASRVLLAAGTLATTRLVWNALPHKPERLRLLSNPMAAFLLLLPAALGSARERAFGLAQLSYELALADGGSAFGNLFSTQGLPVCEFLQHLPLRRRGGLPLLRELLPAAVVGNLFLPGELSDHVLRLDGTGDMRIEPGQAARLPDTMGELRTRLVRGFRRLGAYMLPGSFVPAAPGADLHYAGTLPHKVDPAPHECRLNGELAGLPGIHVLDGAALPILPAKAHTLTVMANAHRIASALPEPPFGEAAP